MTTKNHLYVKSRGPNLESMSLADYRRFSALLQGWESICKRLTVAIVTYCLLTSSWTGIQICFGFGSRMLGLEAENKFEKKNCLKTFAVI